MDSNDKQRSINHQMVNVPILQAYQRVVKHPAARMKRTFFLLVPHVSKPWSILREVQHWIPQVCSKGTESLTVHSFLVERSSKRYVRISFDTLIDDKIFLILHVLLQSVVNLSDNFHQTKTNLHKLAIHCYCL